MKQPESDHVVLALVISMAIASFTIGAMLGYFLSF